MFVLLFVYATIAHYPGTPLWGCYIAGMFFACFDPPHHAHHIWIKQMKRMTSRLIHIFFAGTAAFPIPVTKLLSLEAFWKGSMAAFSGYLPALQPRSSAHLSSARRALSSAGPLPKGRRTRQHHRRPLSMRRLMELREPAEHCGAGAPWCA